MAKMKVVAADAEKDLERSWLTARRGHTLASIVAYNGTPPSDSLVCLLRFRFRSFLFS